MDFAQQLRHKNADVSDIYFTLLDAAGYLQLWFWIRMPKLERDDAGSLSKSERQKLQSCTHKVVMLMGLCAT